MPQADGTSIPFDISVTACIPSVYHHILLLMKKFGIELIFSRVVADEGNRRGSRIQLADPKIEVRHQN